MTSTSSHATKSSEDVLAKLKSNVRNLFNCKRVCGVCLNNTRNLRLGGSIYNISCGENVSEKSLIDIVGATFGCKVPTYLATCYFCEHCIDIILKAYRMLEEIKFNHHILQYYAHKLNHQTKMPLPDDVQSIVFQLDYPNNYEIDSYKIDCNRHLNDCDSSMSSDDDHQENLCKFEQVPKIKKEPEDTTQCKLITVEISEIVEKIKDQITFKKLKAEPVSPKKRINNNTKKAVVNTKLISKRNTGAAKRRPRKVPADKERYYKCFLCDKTFTGERELLIHSRKQCIETSGLKPDESTKKEVCDQCGKLVASYYLKKHKRLHEKMQKQCTVCAQFVNKHSFSKHMHSHSGQPKLRPCPNCEYKSKYPEALDAHINKHHLHIRPYICDKCKKGFHSKLLLREHVKIHTRLKTEQCHVCGDRFSYKKSLMLHMRIHTGDKPYKCHECDECFISASRRQAHVQTKHVGRSLQCEFCSKKFCLRTTLRIHMKKIHQRKERVTSS